MKMKAFALLAFLFSAQAASAQQLNDLVQAWLAAASKTAQPGDYSTCQPEGQPDQICSWNSSKLGAMPTSSQLQAMGPVLANRMAAQQFPSIIASGVTVACATNATTCTSAITGTYALDESAQSKMQAIQLSIDGGHGLPGAGSSFFFKDATGVPHPFTAAQFTEFSIAARDLYYAESVVQTTLAAGQSASWPSTTVTLP